METILDSKQSNSSVMSVSDWVITLLIMAIPFINIVMLFVWAFGNNDNETRANWAKAYLIMMLIGIGLTIIIFSIFGAAIMAGIGAAGGLQ
jgi:type II secretory pathway component PulF